MAAKGDTPSSGPTSDERPATAPSRRRWLLRLGIIAVCVLGALGAVRWWWGVEARRRFDAEIARIRASGAPALPEDLVKDVIPDELNAAVLLIKAAEKITLTQRQQELLGGEVRPEDMTEQDWAEVAAIIETNNEAMALITESLARQQIRWFAAIQLPLMNAVIGHLGPQRDNARLLKAVALGQHHRGDHDQAVQTLRRGLAHAHAVGRSSLLVGYLTANACASLSTSAIERITPSLMAGTSASGAADREQVATLIKELLDTSRWSDLLMHSMEFERATSTEFVQWIRAGSGGFGGMPPTTQSELFDFAIGPMLELQAVEVLATYKQVIDAASQPNWPAARAELATGSTGDSAGQLKTWTRTLSDIMAPSFDRVLEVHFSFLARQRMAATALAIRLYELDHGRRPVGLDDLVPNYLPSVPVDPFDPGGGALRYRPDADPPVLYSVWVNGADDSGRQSGNDFDWPFYLNGPPPQE